MGTTCERLDPLIERASRRQARGNVAKRTKQFVDDGARDRYAKQQCIDPFFGRGDHVVGNRYGSSGRVPLKAEGFGVGGSTGELSFFNRMRAKYGHHPSA